MGIVLSLFNFFFGGGFRQFFWIVAAVKRRDSAMFPIDLKHLENELNAPKKALLPGEAFKAVPNLHETRPWRTCKASDGNIYTLDSRISARDSNTIAADAKYQNPTWIFVKHESSLLREIGDAQEESSQYGLYKIPFIEAWADHEQIQKRSLALRARSMMALTTQASDLQSEIQAAVEAMPGQGDIEAVNTAGGYLGKADAPGSVGDAELYYRTKFDVKPGTFTAADDGEGGLELHCPDDML